MNLPFKYLAFVFVTLYGITLKSQIQNIANDAVVTASTFSSEKFKPSNVSDGIIGIDGIGEWSCEGLTYVWGYIRLPWIRLTWNNIKTIDRIILYDRPSLKEHLSGGMLKFSDGSRLVVTEISNDGLGKVIEFPPKKVKWVEFAASDGSGSELGLSEIEVYSPPSEYGNYLSYVNPYIESAKGRYFFFTPGARPFGMVSAAPITRNKNQYGGGYNFNSLEVIGFGQLHGWMVSGIQIMPTMGNVDIKRGSESWKSKFSHDSEKVSPGYHRLFLDDYGIWTEYTSSVRATFYKLTYTKRGMAPFLVNLGGYLGNSTMVAAEIIKVDSEKIEGSFISSGRFWGGPKKVKVFFAMQFNKPMKSMDGWNQKGVKKDIDQLYGSKKLSRRDSISFFGITQSYWNAPSSGIQANFKVEPGEQILVKIGVSYTSIENAWMNLNSEIPHWDFNTIRDESALVWESMISRIKVKGGTEKQRIKFYTDLWHVLQGRNIINDINGQYPDYTQGKRDWKFTEAELKVRQLPLQDGKAKFNMYNSDALWLTKWNLNVLWGLAWPELQDDFSACLVQYDKNGGLLPRGPNLGGYSYIMTGCPATSMLVSTFQKGLMKKVPPYEAYSAIKKNHMPGGMISENEKELEFYIDNGYCPNNAGKTLEWAFQDWSLGQMALKLKKNKDADYFLNRSKGWSTLFHPQKKMIFPKNERGQWLHEDALAMQGWVESNSWQGTWGISHDLETLAKMMGGKDTLANKLNYAFEQAIKDDFVYGYGNGYVSYANQPGCSNAHVFNEVGKPWLSQFWVREVNEKAYGGTSPHEGYGGHDEDQGQMGAISALMSLGLFSIRGTNSMNPSYELTSPVFDEIHIVLNKDYYPGGIFKIRTRNISDSNVYIRSIKLNGKKRMSLRLSHQEFTEGGVLELTLASKPNRALKMSENLIEF
ncbi:MAG: GH92 family glycosyl hydrolase [Flavobacteriaceae bacterium]|nr:GH92 family glycosyl hydrolase [Flavobacteriaceae bacterium]